MPAIQIRQFSFRQLHSAVRSSPGASQSVFAAQKEFLDALEQINEHWFARAKSEAELATAMADKLAAARSMPDMTIAYQDWLGQRMQRCVEDSNRELADVQKLIQTGSRLAQNGRG
jgi:hypothetical protein